MEQNKLQTAPDILSRFARLLGTKITGNRLEIPASFGSGYCTGFVFNPHIRLLISDYELHQDLDIENPEARGIASRVLFFKFQNIAFTNDRPSSAQIPSVLIATSRIHTDEVISIHSNKATINIEVDADYLGGLLNLPERSPLLQSLLQNTQPLLFEQIVYPSLQKVLNEILTEPTSETFQLFFLRIKAEELICRLLMELDKREERKILPLSTPDIQTIYKVKEQMLKHLDKPPVINRLAIDAGMSPTKLKRLFKQIFGNSIFSYYQEFRIKEAARLLKNGDQLVSAIGYQLGFTNLSHFSRVFERHMGVKPKKYSAR